MAYDNNNYDENKGPDGIFSKRVRAGKRRTYFFDVRETRGNDYFITITESKKRFNDDGYDRHKIFIYKEDFNKFIEALSDTADYVKKELMPDFDFDSFSHDQEEENNVTSNDNVEATPPTPTEAPTSTPEKSAIDEATSNSDNVDSWKI